MATRVALAAMSTPRRLFVESAQRWPGPSGCGELLGRETTTAPHHGKQIMESLQPTVVHVTIAKTARQHMRVGRQRRQIGGFDGEEMAQFLAKVDARSLAHAANSRPQVDHIQVELKDTVLPEKIVQAPRQHGFL